MDANKVFVNCPFDKEYFGLLKALLFTLIYIELNPQISETSDSGVTRLNKIKDLMTNSKYSIHDLSRMEPLVLNDLPRFNMPFECGIDFGIRLANDTLTDKKFLILEKENYRYQKVISDISGNDIKSHKNDPEILMKSVRDWFKPTKASIPGYKEIWLSYNEFLYDYEIELKKDGYDPSDITELTFSDIIENMGIWIRMHKSKKRTTNLTIS